MKGKLVIFEYSTQKVHIYNIDLSVIVDEDYIRNLGFHISECQWMSGEDIEIIRHSGILT